MREITHTESGLIGLAGEQINPNMEIFYRQNEPMDIEGIQNFLKYKSIDEVYIPPEKHRFRDGDIVSAFYIEAGACFYKCFLGNYMGSWRWFRGKDLRVIGEGGFEMINSIKDEYEPLSEKR